MMEEIIKKRIKHYEVEGNHLLDEYIKAEDEEEKDSISINKMWHDIIIAELKMLLITTKE